MTIRFSRHARQRLKLYRIYPERLLEAIKTLDLEKLPPSEPVPFMLEGIPSRIGTPIMVVLFKEEEAIVIRTNYPLRKGKKL